MAAQAAVPRENSMLISQNGNRLLCITLIDDMLVAGDRWSGISLGCFRIHDPPTRPRRPRLKPRQGTGGSNATSACGAKGHFRERPCAEGASKRQSADAPDGHQAIAAGDRRLSRW